MISFLMEQLYKIALEMSSGKKGKKINKIGEILINNRTEN
jgi:hypothetical protein